MWQVELTRRASSSGDDQLHGSGGGSRDFATTAGGHATPIATRDERGSDMVRDRRRVSQRQRRFTAAVTRTRGVENMKEGREAGG